ncbi:MAG TPA: hypothetical protein VGW33_15380 [Terriglobia bacterium]|nr:hypothetical protein [Terriglobia bacterium]
MAYTPAYNALFAKPLLNQLIAIIQRDQASAIGIVNPQLAPINEFHKGSGLRTAFPWLTLAADNITFTEDVLGTRQSRSRVSLALDVGQFDQEMAEDNAQDYARVLDMVITTASAADWETPLPITNETVPGGVTMPSASGSVKEVFVESHSYGVVNLQQIEIPVLRVTLALQFHLEEV